MEINLNLNVADQAVQLPTEPDVPNEFPILPSANRIAIVGEAPGADEVTSRRPFVGASGRLLDTLMSNAGLERSRCLMANVSQHRPPNNDIKAFDWSSYQIQGGLQKLREDIAKFDPNIVILLGATPLRAAKGEPCAISDWRGTLFVSDHVYSPFAGRKCMASYHPAYVLRDFAALPILLWDLKRAKNESTTKELELPQRTFELDLSADEICNRLSAIQPGTLVSFDIEGRISTHMTCCSVSTDPFTGFIIALSNGQGEPRYTEDEEMRIWVALGKMLSNPNIPKVLQNSLYDRFVLAWLYGILIRNVNEDTMLKHWELYCELEKSLGFQASIYTREPYYKSEIKSNDMKKFWTYCCKDSAVTLEISQSLDQQLFGEQLAHYRFNVDMLNPILFMELRGIRYDVEAAAAKRKELLDESYTLQHKINQAAGRTLSITSTQDVLDLCNEIICKKKFKAQTLEEVPSLAYAAFTAASYRIVEICKQLPEPLSEAQLGELSMLFKRHLNVESTAASGDMQWYLYTYKALPVVYKKEKGKLTNKRTADVIALLTLYKKTNDSSLLDLLKMRSLNAMIESLSVKADADNRIRCGYNLVGTETGRLSCYESPTGSGYNLQTVTKKLRHLFKADEGKLMFQIDLSGADGLTVAAHCRKIGDSTMWEDYAAKLKPAKIIALMYEAGEEINTLSREQLRWACEDVDEESWLYFASKVVQHGSSYRMGANTMSDQILKNSYKIYGEPIVVAPAACSKLQQLFFRRYWGIPKWNDWVAAQILSTSQLRSAGGHVRKFFGRKKDAGGTLNHETWKAALADEPQNNTTYATNLAVMRLWGDKANRDGSGRLIIEPLHVIHDALLGQFPADRLDWAKDKIRSYFTNTLTIAGQDVIIPFAGGYGPSWGELKEKI